MPHIKLHSKSRGSKNPNAMGCLITFIFGGVFAAVGTGMFIFFTVLPLWHIFEARSWAQTPCTITHSQVKTNPDSDGDTYEIDIRYTYEFKGKTYRGETYRFAPPGSSSGYDGKRKAVDAHPVGSEQTCYVDPDDPKRSVINRGPTAALWWGLFPIPFMAVGYGFLYAGLTGKLDLGTRGKESGWRPATKDPSEPSGLSDGLPQQSRTAHASALSWTQGDANEPVVFDPRRKRRMKFIGIALFALFWNGIVGTIGYGLPMETLNEGLSFTTLFFAPFLIAGLVMLYFTVRSGMLVLAPKIVIELGRDTLPLGGSTLLRWHIADARKNVNRVTIQLIGEEHATYRRGTDSVTDTATFYEQVLVGEDTEKTGRSVLPIVADHGDVVLQVPSDTMHTLSANNNKIIWKLIVRADVSLWPDPKDDYEITVLPMPVATAAQGSDSR